MFGTWATKCVLRLLKSSTLSTENRNLLTTCLLDKLVALPLHDMIRVNEEGQLLVNERPVSLEGARALREGAKTALQNKALELIREQVAYTAIAMGVHTLKETDESFFMRAAIWWGQREMFFLKLLAGDEEPAL